MSDTGAYYKNFVSLGYFCGVAEDLRHLKLRTMSSPFDWCISDFEGVVEALNNEFTDFMVYENLEQNQKQRNYYRDSKYDIQFFHDFTQYKSLDKQYKKVKEKYDRRIARFLEKVKEPTLFFRYISSEEKVDGKSAELLYIEQNYDYINDCVRRFHLDNRIIYVADETVQSDIVPIYHVQIDENDTVCRHPLYQNKDLLIGLVKIIMENNPDEEPDIEIKIKAPMTFFEKVKEKLKNLYHKFLCRVYVHEKEYEN